MMTDTVENELKLDREPGWRVADDASADARTVPSARSAKSAPAREPPVIDVRALVGEGREAAILHGGEVYRLRITSRDRLILTK